ncbi:MAG: heparinase II/III family protein [Acidobacteria bacterium]|nr:heparinase II/III family protein [Acidobacteriota bacterium]
MHMRTAWCALAMAGAVWGQSRLFTAEDLERVAAWSQSERWAADARTALVRSAETWPKAHLDRFGLQELALPADGGQWTLWYVCPVHGVSLQYQPPNTHRCPVDGRVFTGWPFDQVIFSRRHSDLAAAARDNALAYRLTGIRKYAEAAAWILKEYAAKYLTYPIKDKDNRPNVRSGARVGAQTLDEAVWLIPVAWAYDLLAGSDVLAAAERDGIERTLLRPAVEVIQRNDAGVSNWQSWHNAAIGAVGFALPDQGLIQQAVDGRSGFRFQMNNSVIGEGFWYEGAWSYHYYALDPLIQLAEMAVRSGMDLWAEPGLRGMFSAPLKLTFADGSLPAFNDSNTVNLAGYARMYDVAYGRYGDPLFAAVARKGSRGRDALLFGARELEPAELWALQSEVISDAGFAVLRAPSGDHAVTMKFGPHGGGHGHYDKLGLISYAYGCILAVDPGTQSYAAPTHDTWDKMTVAHNTVVVDERTQKEATGKLLWRDLAGEYSAVRAEAGPAYDGVRLERTLLVTADYLLDVFRADAADARPRKLDWVYHNFGSLEAGLAMTPYNEFPKQNGYQHLTENRAVETAGPWQVRFDGTPREAVNYGAVYASTAEVAGLYQHSMEQSSGGRFSGKLSYDFRGAGYLLFSTPLLGGQPDRTPSGLRVSVFGDGSGHPLTLRINDATDERFVIGVGPVSWTGWKTLDVHEPAKWQHYLGNNDGLIDTPIRTVAFELQQSAPGPRTGALYVDDITVLYGSEARLAEDFELLVRHLRLWMLGEEATTVVSGKGLGPDLLKPAPYVMARRQGQKAEFLALLEPYRTEPQVVEFRREQDGLYVIRGALFEDRFRLGEQGVEGYVRVILRGQ